MEHKLIKSNLRSRSRSAMWAGLLPILLSACQLADLSNGVVNKQSTDREAKAVTLLQAAINIQNYSVLEQKEFYTIKVRDKYKGFMSVANAFPHNGRLMEMRYRANSFDGQFHYLNTDDQDVIHGLQSFRYYQQDARTGSLDTIKSEKGIAFNIQIVQYLFELPIRLINAPIIKYAGTREKEGIAYDLVFVSWKSVAPNNEHDQFLLYINADTKHLDFANFTSRQTTMPAPKNLYASVHFRDKVRHNSGLLYPSAIIVQMNELKDENKYVHKITVEDLSFNDFDQSALYPIEDLEYLGDAKLIDD